MAGGTNNNRHRMRCSRGKQGCNRRFTLPHPLRWYGGAVCCPHCRCDRPTDVEASRRAEQLSQTRCRCSAYPFPHNSGTMRMCKHHPLIEVEPTEEEIDQYQSCLETPRSGVC